MPSVRVRGCASGIQGESDHEGVILILYWCLCIRIQGFGEVALARVFQNMRDSVYLLHEANPKEAWRQPRTVQACFPCFGSSLISASLNSVAHQGPGMAEPKAITREKVLGKNPFTLIFQPPTDSKQPATCRGGALGRPVAKEEPWHLPWCKSLRRSGTRPTLPSCAVEEPGIPV